MKVILLGIGLVGVGIFLDYACEKMNQEQKKVEQYERIMDVES